MSVICGHTTQYSSISMMDRILSQWWVSICSVWPNILDLVYLVWLGYTRYTCILVQLVGSLAWPCSACRQSQLLRVRTFTVYVLASPHLHQYRRHATGLHTAARSYVGPVATAMSSLNLRTVPYYRTNLGRRRFYRAMLRRARYCYGKLSVCPSVRNVEVLWLHRLEIFKNNFMSRIESNVSAHHLTFWPQTN